MVKTRVNDFFTLNKKHNLNIFNRFGTSITYVSITETYNSLGRIATKTETSTTITGDLQPITLEDKQLIDSGEAKLGDAKLFVNQDTSLSADNYITHNSINWTLIKELESPEIKGSAAFHVWLCQRRD